MAVGEVVRRLPVIESFITVLDRMAQSRQSVRGEQNVECKDRLDLKWLRIWLLRTGSCQRLVDNAEGVYSRVFLVNLRIYWRRFGWQFVASPHCTATSIGHPCGIRPQ